MKALLGVLFCFFLLSSPLAGQSNNYQIDGIIEDTLGNALIYSTVLLMEKADSTMIDFTRSELDGSFRFKDVPAGNHIVKSTYLGYLPLTVDASSSKGDNVDLGILKMSEIAAELMEVVIKAAKAPMRMRGDTIEYDASTFKVPEGSTVEDLLRRLPGIEVESDGTINADGKNVSRVTVDGKSFFGSDPKAATKNLPAEGVSKVQVFDTKTEEEEITGATTESQDKTMNLELKEEFKSGGFGKVIAGIGDEDRKELKGNYNKFNKKIQFSIVGVGNNTGRNGLSWDDYQDFMGSQSWNFSDGTDYGFGGRGFRYYFGGSDGGIEQSIQNMFFSGNQAGLPENYNAGINFNYDHNKTKLSSVYYYNQSGLLANTNRDQDKFYDNFVQQETMESSADDLSKGHRTEIKLEHEIDSLHTLKIDINAAHVNDSNIYSGQSSLSRDSQLTSASDFSNNSTTTGSLFNGLLLLRKKFKKKGRKMGINTTYLVTELEDTWDQKSDTDFFSDDGMVESTLNINQQNNNIADKSLFKANLLFVEPLSKKYFLQTFFNFRDRKETGTRVVNDIEGQSTTLNEDLSREYENTIKYKRAGTAIRYSHNGINLSVGAAYQFFDLDGTYISVFDESVLGTVDNTFNNVIPHFSLNFNPVRNAYVSLGYGRNPKEPSIRDLAPLVDNINPLFIKEGNPTLEPEISNDINAYLSRNYPLSDIRLNLNARMSFYESQFSTEENVDSRLVTTYKPINVEGGSNLFFSTRVSFPIIRNKIKVRMAYSGRFNSRPSLVNDINNNTNINSHTPELKIDITPSEHTSIYLLGRYRTSNTSYDINTSQDQKTVRTEMSVEINSKIAAGFFISTTMSYDRYTNDRFNLDRTIPIWNSSIYKQFLEGNKVELRLSLYDGLNRNVGFNQSAYGNGISQTETVSLGRYAMLSLTYNIRGMKSDVRKDSWW